MTKETEKHRFLMDVFYCLVWCGENVRSALKNFRIDFWSASMGMSVLRKVAMDVAPDANVSHVAKELFTITEDGGMERWT